MTDDLVKRLREGDHFERVMSAEEAADRIEELEAANKRLNEQMDAIEEMGTESLNALPDCLMRLAPALVENDELKAKLAKAVELVERAFNEGFGSGMDDVLKSSGGKTWYDSRSRKRLAELKGQDDE